MSAPTLSPAVSSAPGALRAPLTKKVLVADHPTWCPGCGDFAVLASFYKVLEKLNYPQEKIVTFAGIGCSSRFPYFVNTHGSIGGNHLVHTARKNPRMTYVIMDNSVYGLTKKQTSPTSPIGFKSKTDPWGAYDQPINPMRTLINSGATFIARSHATQVNHMVEMMHRAALHDGFSVVEILSECVEFFEGAFDASIPRKGGSFQTIDLKKNDGSAEDAARHDPTDELAALRLALDPWPGKFGIYYENKNRPTKNALEQKLITNTREKTKNASDLELLSKTFARMR
jgi:2-oxoglutarate ferredoxin oxidoreductase subunit beta